MIEARRYGDAIEPRDRPPLTEMAMRFVPIDLVVQWRRCGMIADFLADFLAYNFERKDTARNVISTGLNELLENAVKFTAQKQNRASLVLAHFGDVIRVRITNVADEAHTASLVAFMEKLGSTDAEQLFIDQLEFTANASQGASGLGLITLKKDYAAKISADVKPHASGPDQYEIAMTLELEAEALDNA